MQRCDHSLHEFPSLSAMPIPFIKFPVQDIAASYKFEIVTFECRNFYSDVRISEKIAEKLMFWLPRYHQTCAAHSFDFEITHMRIWFQTQ